LAERLIALPVLAVGMVTLVVILLKLHQHWHPQGPLMPGILAVVLIVFSSAAAMIAPALLVSNIVSWLTPSLRAANLAAMEGLAAISYRRANIGLAQYGVAIFIACAAQGMLGALEPWAQ
jgi:hypothetical protein